MRTNIVLNDELLEEARRREEYAERVADIRKRTSNLRLRKSSSAILREDRNRR